ncbi:MAG: hypothetical protein NWT02_08685 [Opitutales bacterium]|nr:hypothetical protein [Opitutales bacterium]MDP5080424.1 hypothetical protein [Opitutales bacterium]
MSDLPERKRPAQQSVHEHGNRSSIIFVTVCTHERQSILAQKDIHHLLIKSWEAANHWLVGHYMIMPDHIHLFCAPANYEHTSIQQWIRFWKSYASKQWPRIEEQPIWQTNAWDRQLRSGDSYSEKWAYVQNNPVRQNKVTNAADWPYQGELNTLYWHD